jgi:hypothetical protein
LFIDELHTLVGAGAAEGAIDAASILKPMLARGELHTIGATTLDEFRKYVEKDAALERRFQPIRVGVKDSTDRGNGYVVRSGVSAHEMCDGLGRPSRSSPLRHPVRAQRLTEAPDRRRGLRPMTTPMPRRVAGWSAPEARTSRLTEIDASGFRSLDGGQRAAASTRSATAICCSRLALCAEPLPPYARQVLALNCRPP